MKLYILNFTMRAGGGIELDVRIAPNEISPDELHKLQEAVNSQKPLQVKIDP